MRNTVKMRVSERVARPEDFVFLPKESLDLGGRYQVGRALRQLCKDGTLLRVYGMYSKARRSTLSGELITAADTVTLVRQVFNKVGAPWRESQSVLDYNAGLSTQIPANPIPTVYRFSRKITVNGREADYRVSRNPDVVPRSLDELKRLILGRFRSWPAGTRFRRRVFDSYDSRANVLRVLRLLVEEGLIVRDGSAFIRPQPIKPAAKAPSRRKAVAA